MKTDFDERATDDPHHVVEESVSRIGKHDPAPLFLDFDSIQAADRAFFHSLVSAEALKMARTNGQRLHVEDRAQWLCGDLFEKVTGAFDLIVSNPPYIRSAEIEELQEEVRLYDPRIALDGAEDGLLFYRRIIEESKSYLKNGGRLLFEIGCDQGRDVAELLENVGYTEVSVKKDLAGLDRVAAGRLQ